MFDRTSKPQRAFQIAGTDAKLDDLATGSYEGELSDAELTKTSGGTDSTDRLEKYLQTELTNVLLSHA
jgi:hypothetical protein